MSFYLTRQRGKQAFIDFNRDSLSLYNHIRGYSKPFFGAFFLNKNEKISVWKASVESWQGQFGKPGKIINKDENGIEIAVGDGSIIFNEIEINNVLYKGNIIPFEIDDELNG
jgi:methionyl-tRNA formyltransferase